ALLLPRQKKAINQMSNINQYLREHLGKTSKSMLIAPDIPEKKLNNAVKAFGYSGSVSHIVALLDNTLFGSGKEGLLFTGQQLFHKAVLTDPVCVPYTSIDAVRHVVDFTGAKKDKKVESVEIALQDGGKVAIAGLMECDYGTLATVLQSATQSFEEYKEEKQ